MATTTTPLQEKLTLFWHGHFATANYKVSDMLLMYQQNALFRANAAGNFRDDLVHPMSLQPAMLIWLDNDPNEKGNPNENFARELMELFTLGVDQYTQDDVVASARAWTGHNTLDSDREQFHFYPEPPRRRHEDVHGRRPRTGTARESSTSSSNATRRTSRSAPGSSRRSSGRSSRIPTPTRRSSTTSRKRFSTPTSRSTTSSGRSSCTRTFVSTQAKQGLVRSPAEWVVACMKAVNITAERCESAVVDERHGPAIVRAAERVGVAAQRLLAHDLAHLGPRQLAEQPGLAGQRAKHAQLDHVDERCRRGSGGVRPLRHRQPVGPHPHDVAELADRATRRQQRVDQLVVHQPLDPRAAEPRDSALA